jgi:uncharacterized protein YdhG (YjbR/CyaY superfamily)
VFLLKDVVPVTIDAYIARFPKEAQERLQRLRQVIQKAAPDAEEAIRYQMSTFRLAGKNLVFFAAFTHHIGFYPIPSGVLAFKKELRPYKQGKGSVQFPLDEPIPYDLVRRIVLFRVRETMEKKGQVSKKGSVKTLHR